MSEKISAGGCDYHAEHGCASLREEWHRAGNTIRALQEQLDAANVRAEEAEQALAALRAETADLREIERCKKSIEAAGCQWTCNSKRPPRCSIAWCGDYTAWMNAGPEGVGETVEGWQSAERAAWGHAAVPYRARIEAAGCALELRFGEAGLCPVHLSADWVGYGWYGDPGGYPTLPALEEAVAWAEAHPANANTECCPGSHTDGDTYTVCHSCLHGDAEGLPCWVIRHQIAGCKHAAKEPNAIPCYWEPKPASPATDPCAGHSCAECCTDSVKLHACLGCKHGNDPVFGECRYTPVKPHPMRKPDPSHDCENDEACCICAHEDNAKLHNVLDHIDKDHPLAAGLTGVWVPTPDAPANHPEIPESPLFRPDYSAKFTIDGMPVNARLVELSFTRTLRDAGPETVTGVDPAKPGSERTVVTMRDVPAKPCKCGHVHSHCRQCAHTEKGPRDEPCVRCSNDDCQYEPPVHNHIADAAAPVTCPRCGKRSERE